MRFTMLDSCLNFIQNNSKKKDLVLYDKINIYNNIDRFDGCLQLLFHCEVHSVNNDRIIFDCNTSQLINFVDTDIR